MIISTAKSLIYNGHVVQYAFYNGERVWPTIIGDWHTLTVENTASDVAIGLTAMLGNTPVYERPISTGDFTASIVEDSVLHMSVVNSAYNRPDISSTGITFAKESVQTGDSATSTYTASMTGDASVTMPSLHANNFFASGTFTSASFSSQTCDIWVPAEMTYLSGESSVSALTPVFSGIYGGGSIYTAVPTFTPNVDFYTYSASSKQRGGGRVYSNVNNTDMWISATSYIGNQYVTAYDHTTTTLYLHTAAAYGSSRLRNFKLTASEGRIDSGSYSYFGVRVNARGKRTLSISINTESNAGWEVSGIAP